MKLKWGCRTHLEVTGHENGNEKGMGRWDDRVLWEETTTLGSWGKRACPAHIPAGAVGLYWRVGFHLTLESREFLKEFFRISGHSWEKPWGSVETFESWGAPEKWGRWKGGQGEGALLLFHLAQDCISGSDYTGSWKQWWKEIQIGLQWGSGVWHWGQPPVKGSLCLSEAPVRFWIRKLQYSEVLSQLAGACWTRQLWDLGGFKYYFKDIL